MYFYLLMNKDFIIIIIIRNAGFWHFWLAVCIIRNAITAKFQGIFWVASPLNPMFFLLTPPLKPYFFSLAPLKSHQHPYLIKKEQPLQ